MPMKKFNTRGEEFFDFLKSLGYQPPKHQKGEHYDYIFQDEEVTKKIKAMMRKIKPQNIMDPDELQRFQLLKDDGQVLYGKDLEDTMDREKSIERKIEEDISTANAKEAQWCHLIEKRKTNIDKLNALNAILNQTVGAQEAEDAQKKQLIHKWEAENINLNKEILIDRKMLIEKVDELQNTLEEIIAPATFNKVLNRMDKENPSSLVDLDWARIMQDEDRLMNMIRPMLEKYGTDLIRKASGEGEGVLESEGIQRIFVQYAKDFERLKHSIVYEKIRETGRNDIMLAGDKGVCEKIDECIQEVERLSQLDDAALLKKMKQEVQEDTDQLEETLQFEKDRALQHIKNLVITELNDDIKELVDLKAQAKRNLQEFLEFVVDILSVQKVRVDIIRELSRTEGREIEKLARQLNEQKRQLSNLQIKQELLSEGITESKLSPEGSRLFQALQKFGVPLSVLESHTNTMVSLSAIRKQVDIDKMKALEQNNTNVSSFSHKLIHKQTVIRGLFEKVRTQDIENDVEKLIQELEKTHVDLQNKLVWHSKNKQQIVQDKINQKWAAMKRMQKALSKVENGD